MLTKFPDETGGAALTALVTTLGRTSVDGWTEDAADVAVDLSAEPGTQPVTVGALGSMQSLTIKLGGSHAVAPHVHAQDMLTLGVARPTEVTPHTTWSEVSRRSLLGVWAAFSENSQVIVRPGHANCAREASWRCRHGGSLACGRCVCARHCAVHKQGEVE